MAVVNRINECSPPAVWIGSWLGEKGQEPAGLEKSGKGKEGNKFYLRWELNGHARPVVPGYRYAIVFTEKQGTVGGSR